MATDTKIEELLYGQLNQQQYQAQLPKDQRDFGNENNKSLNSLTPTREQSLDQLNEYQKGLVEEYYKLQTSPSCADNVAEKRLCAIWKVAETDPVLCRHLEFIDELCNSSSDKITEKDSDNRAYWEEYLVPEFRTKLDWEEGKIPERALAGFTWNIICPDGQNLGKITIPSDDPTIIQQFKEQICSRCQTPYDMHDWELLPEAVAHH
jgi:hypothetical protein